MGRVECLRCGKEATLKLEYALTGEVINDPTRERWRIFLPVTFCSECLATNPEMKIIGPKTTRVLKGEPDAPA